MHWIIVNTSKCNTITIAAQINTVPYHCNTVLTDIDCRIQSLVSFYQGAYLDDLFSVTIDSDPPFGINFIVQ